MKMLITLGALLFVLAAKTAPRPYQYKDISADAANPFTEKERAKANEEKKSRLPAESRSQNAEKKTERGRNDKEIR